MDAITRKETFLNAIATGEDIPEPLTREEFFLAKVFEKVNGIIGGGTLTVTDDDAGNVTVAINTEG